MPRLVLTHSKEVSNKVLDFLHNVVHIARGLLHSSDQGQVHTRSGHNRKQIDAIVGNCVERSGKFPVFMGELLGRSLDLHRKKALLAKFV